MTPNAQEWVKKTHPTARVVRSTFGLVVEVEETGKTMGDGRAYWEEEAWISAAEEEGQG